MQKLLSKMKMENKYNQTIRKQNLDIGIEYTIKAMKCVIAKYGNKLVIITLKMKQCISVYQNHLILQQLILKKKIKKIKQRYDFKDYWKIKER